MIVSPPPDAARLDGRMVMQRTANPSTPVRFRLQPPVPPLSARQNIPVTFGFCGTFLEFHPWHFRAIPVRSHAKLWQKRGLKAVPTFDLESEDITKMGQLTARKTAPGASKSWIQRLAIPGRRRVTVRYMN